MDGPGDQQPALPVDALGVALIPGKRIHAAAPVAGDDGADDAGGAYDGEELPDGVVVRARGEVDVADYERGHRSASVRRRAAIGPNDARA